MFLTILKNVLFKLSNYYKFFSFFRTMASGAGSSGTGRGRGSSLADNKPENKEAKPNPKMSKALGTSAKR